MTYSIVARDPQTGDLGVAVQSHYFGAGCMVTWAEAGVGVVATQSIVEVSYGPRGIDAMRDGTAADVALADLVGADPMEAVRQVAMIDANGVTATHTGAGCVGQAGHRQGDQVSAQANMMERDTVWGAMLDAYAGASGQVLAERLFKALEAAEAEGGDVRGKQSAAILVVSGQRSEAPWDQRLVDLRVDDAEVPLAEMRRLLDVHAAVDKMTGVFDSGLLFAPDIGADDPALLEALADLRVAQDGLGSNREPSFWSAGLLAKAGRIDDAQASQHFASETNPRWPKFLQSVASAGVLADDNGLLIEN
jgi:uncharacterized Ntn-hydrolase superfamily protein